MSESNRRNFLKIGVGAAGAMLFSGAKAVAAVCTRTAPQTSGPFYPGESKFQKVQDLTQLEGHSKRALGEVVYVKGRVLDQNCKPVAGATVEIWQACATGKYNAPNDPNPAEMDPNFRYWAEAITDQNGEYLFKTIKPGAYPADTGWTRPPHIHFKVSKLGYRELVTQMYFKGESLNDQDQILQDLSASDRAGVIVDFQGSPVGFEPGTRMGNFEITIRTVR